MDPDAGMNHVYVPPGGPPQGPGPSPEIYQAMGEEKIFRMCRDFYAKLEASDIRSMFPEDMPAASEKIAAFLVGLCGGPPLYMERYGSPQMRKRHLAFPIDEHARQTWLNCFKKVLENAVETYEFPEPQLKDFVAFLERFSAWMVNRGPER